MLGTILSELHMDQEYLLSLNISKLQVLYIEALRQRANKAFMLMELLGSHRLEHKSDRKKLIEGYAKLTKPLNIMRVTEVNKNDVKVGWATLRGRKR